MTTPAGKGGSGKNLGAQKRNDAGRQRNRGQSNGRRRFSQNAPSQRSRSSDPARLTAFRVLRSVSDDDAYANLVLPQEIRKARLDKRDAAFATELSYGTLRSQGTYDAILSECIDRPLEKLDPPLLDALRLGAHQVLAMRVENHAAVNETVGLVRFAVGAGPGSFANAVLRKVAQKPFEEWVTALTGNKAHEDPSTLSLRYAHPKWIVRSLQQALRTYQRSAELVDLLQADNLAPEVHLVALPDAPKSHLNHAVEAGAIPSEVLRDAAIFRGGDVGRLTGVAEGELRVQDIGSQWIARALAEAQTPHAASKSKSESTAEHMSGPVSEPQENWLDMCAGPGGKAALLAALAARKGHFLTANEPASHRAKLVEKALAPVKGTAWKVRVGDGRTIADEGVSYDRILVDAPCTGLGALRRRPESRWRRKPSDIAELTALQAELIDAAIDVLAPGGLFAYVTCSPHSAETHVQVEDALKRHPNLKLLNAHEAMNTVSLPSAPVLNSEHGPAENKLVQLWPHSEGTDAMFFALFYKPLP